MKKIIFKFPIFLGLIVVVLFCVLILSLTLRGNPGTPTADDLSSSYWREGGPFELSPERGRYALTYSIVENGSVHFPENIARFASPDVGEVNGKYVSIFAPLLSYLIIPGYFIGKYVGAAQVGTFAIVSIFAILNVVLLRLISVRLGASNIAATIASFVFIFGTPAFSYAVNLYQHHVSTFLMLASLYALLRYKKTLALIIVFFTFACAIPLDYPNLFFLAPIAIYAALQIVNIKKIKEKMTLKINLIKLLTPIFMIFPILFFLWFNQAAYGNPFQISGTVNNAVFDQPLADTNSLASSKTQEKPVSQQKNALAFFNTRNLLNGLYIEFVSPDRGVMYYTPVMIFGVVGFVLSIRRKVKYIPLLVSIVGMNILLYSMWGDPWGGWAFGARYLIPTYAILSLCIALALTYMRKKILFLLLFTAFAFYSIAVNTLGAITTSALPPQIQILELEKVSGVVQKYTWERNYDLLITGHTKSFVYQTFLKDLFSPVQFYQLLTISICIFIGPLIFYNFLSTKKEVSKSD